MTLCFLVTSITARVAPLETAPTRSLTSSWRMSFSALRTAGAGLVSSSSDDDLDLVAEHAALAR